MPTLYLHVGPHKTGSTYLQEAFKKQAGRLKSRGVEYPEIGREHSSAHHNIAWFFAERPQIGIKRLQLKENLSELCQKEGVDLLLSSEEFSKISPKGLYDLKEAFLHWDFHVLYFVRKGGAFILSLWQESIKNGLTIPLNEATLRSVSENLNYNPLGHRENIAGFEQCLAGRVSVIDYNDLALSKTDLILPVAEIIKADLKPGRKRVNPGLSQEIIELIRAANLHNAAIGKRRRGFPRVACLRILKIPILSGTLKRNLGRIFDKYHRTLSNNAFLDMGYQAAHLLAADADRMYKYLPETTLLDELNKDNVLPWRIIKKYIQKK